VTDLQFESESDSVTASGLATEFAFGWKSAFAIVTVSAIG
jgi:hypothetical protein